MEKKIEMTVDEILRLAKEAHDKGVLNGIDSCNREELNKLSQTYLESLKSTLEKRLWESKNEGL